MPQTSAPTRKKPNDVLTPSFATPPKITLGQLDLNNIGADSPELALSRARYQTTRQNTLATQIETAPNQNINPATSNPSSPTENEVEDMFETDSERSVATTNKTQSSTRGENTEGKVEKDDKDKLDRENKEKKAEDSTENKNVSQNTKSNSRGGGNEKKDPGVKPGALPQNEISKKPQEKSEQASDDSKATQLGQAKVEALKNLKSVQDKLKSGDLSGAVEGVTAASKVASSWALTAMWGAVWLDWTLLTLLGLNVYFVASSFTDKIASFGEDYLFGKWMPKELAKWFEVILLALLDMIVLSIIFMILYGGYKFYTASFWDTFFGAVKGVVSGEGAATGATKEILKP